VAKNYTKGYTDTQTKIRDATSNDPWGPSGTQMNEIAQLTYNQCVLRIYITLKRNMSDNSRERGADAIRSDFVEVMEMLDKRLNDKGKNWRHVFKVNY
jgi:epsin